MSVEREPVYSASIVGGAATGFSYLVLEEPMRDLLLEAGSSERLASAVVRITMALLPVGVAVATAWWARRRVVPVETANNRIQLAAELHPSEPQATVEELKFTKGSESPPSQEAS